MGFTCIKPMKVQTDVGVVEQRMPGDPVPEADNWANPSLWIKRGYIQADDHETALACGHTRNKPNPMVKATAEDIARGTNSPVPKKGEPLPDLPPEIDTKSELMAKRRVELDSLAIERGIDPEEYSNKNDLVAAILES